MTNQKVNARYSPEARDIYFTVPNLISALRIISIPFISVLISKHEMIAALALIAISSASDGLDGIIARRFNQVSKIGQILDPIADRLLIFCSILALSVAGIIPWWILLPIFNMLNLVFVDYEMMEKSRFESAIMSKSQKEIQNHGKRISKTTWRSLFTIISTLIVTFVFVIQLIKLT